MDGCVVSPSIPHSVWTVSSACVWGVLWYKRVAVLGWWVIIRIGLGSAEVINSKDTDTRALGQVDRN